MEPQNPGRILVMLDFISEGDLRGLRYLERLLEDRRVSKRDARAALKIYLENVIPRYEKIVGGGTPKIWEEELREARETLDLLNKFDRVDRYKFLKIDCGTYED